MRLERSYRKRYRKISLACTGRTYTEYDRILFILLTYFDCPTVFAFIGFPVWLTQIQSEESVCISSLLPSFIIEIAYLTLCSVGISPFPRKRQAYL